MLSVKSCQYGVRILSISSMVYELTLIVLGDRMSQSVGVGSIVLAGFVASFNMVLI